MGNSSWACFDCRQAVRRPTHHRADVPCSRCGKPSSWIGYKIRVPVRDDKKAWGELWKWLNKQQVSAADRLLKERVRRRHELEQEIARLESRPPSDGRRSAIRLLRTKLKALRDR